MREKILNGAAALIQTYGLKKFTVNELVAELGISKKTVYQYFDSKDVIIAAYFDTAIQSDKESTLSAVSKSSDFAGKIHAIVYSEHKYRLSVSLLAEAKRLYPAEWEKVEQLKQFKLEIAENVFAQGVKDGIFKGNVHFGVLSAMLTKLGDLFTDYEFLTSNRLSTRDAIEEALEIIFHGILESTN